MKKFKEYLNESTKGLYFHRVRYSVSKNWYRPGGAIEVFRTVLMLSPEGIIKSFTLEEEKETKVDGELRLNFLAKIYSDVDKKTIQEYFNGKFHRAEIYTVL